MLRAAAAVAVVIALALGGAAGADGPEAGPFPYGDLALLAEAEAPRTVRITLREAATAHERPGGNWPVVARVRAGRQLVATAATPGGAPWLRVRLRTGRVCWLRSAAVEVTAGRIEWLPLVRAPVLLPATALKDLSAAVAAPRILLRSDTLVRLRPALDWPVLAKIEAGKSLAATAVTPGGDPWLRVELADGEAGWIQLAATDAPDALIARLPFGSAQPITTDYALLTGDIRAWPDGPFSGLTSNKTSWSSENTGWPRPLLGRSVDGGWAAIMHEGFTPPVVWMREDEEREPTDGASIADLPIFVGGGLTVLALNEEEADSTLYFPFAGREWWWTADGEIVVARDPLDSLVDAHKGIWAIDPSSGERRAIQSRVWNTRVSPDGRYIAWETWGEGDDEAWEVVIAGVDGREPLVVADVYSPWWSDAPSSFYQSYRDDLKWSPDSRALLVPRVHLDWYGLDWRSGAGVASIVTVEGEVFALPEEAPVGYQRDWEWLPNGQVVFRGAETVWVASARGEALRTISLPEFASFSRQSDGAAVDLIVSRSHGWLAVNLDSGEIAPVEGLPEMQRGYWVQWTPDGMRAAICETYSGKLFLYAAAANSAVEIPLPGASAGCARGSGATIEWAPNGERFLLRTGRGMSRLGQLFVVDLDPVAVVEVRLGVGQWFGFVCVAEWHWSPDSEQFAVELSQPLFEQAYDHDGLGALPGGFVGFSSTEIQIYDRFGRFVRGFRTLGGRLESVVRAEWSPDGRWIAIGPQRWTGPSGCAGGE